MNIFVVVGENTGMGNISARAVFTTKVKAQEWIDDPVQNWFNDKTVIVGPLELDPTGEKTERSDTWPYIKLKEGK